MTQNTIQLNNIKEYQPGLSPGISLHLLEACIVTLYRHSHEKGYEIQVFGDESVIFGLDWDLEFNDQLNRAWKDQSYATEHAAICIAILLAQELIGHIVIERSVKTTGFDYWIGKSNDVLFQEKARLEVSGIFKGSKNEMNKRFNKKTEQTKQSDYLGLHAYISITEFSNLMSHFRKK